MKTSQKSSYRCRDHVMRVRGRRERPLIRPLALGGVVAVVVVVAIGVVVVERAETQRAASRAYRGGGDRNVSDITG